MNKLTNTYSWNIFLRHTPFLFYTLIINLILGMNIVYLYDKLIIIQQYCWLYDYGGIYRDKSTENRFDRPSRSRFPLDRPETKLCTRFTTRTVDQFYRSESVERNSQPFIIIATSDLLRRTCGENTCAIIVL